LRKGIAPYPWEGFATRRPLWGGILATKTIEESAEGKAAMMRTAGSITGYTGPPKDVEELQAWAGIMQKYTKRVIARIEEVEEAIRKL